MWLKGRRLTVHTAGKALQEVRGRTGQVVLQVLDGALAGHDGLHEESEHGEHGQAPVLDLLHLRGHSNGLRAPSHEIKSTCSEQRTLTQSPEVHAKLLV